MKRLSAVAIGLALVACSGAQGNEDLFEAVQADATCAQRSGSYVATYVQRSGTCGPAGQRVTNLDRQPTTASMQSQGCTGPGITYDADNCEVTYDSTCPEDDIASGAHLRVVGHSQWNSDGSHGTATEQWSAIDAKGQTMCLSVYDVNLRRQ
jgi:hypothetical protein